MWRSHHKYDSCELEVNELVRHLPWYATSCLSVSLVRTYLFLIAANSSTFILHQNRFDRRSQPRKSCFGGTQDPTWALVLVISTLRFSSSFLHGFWRETCMTGAVTYVLPYADISMTPIDYRAWRKAQPWNRALHMMGTTGVQLRNVSLSAANFKTTRYWMSREAN